MAAQEQVKQFVASWMQLGKPIWIHGGQTAVKPKVILQGNQYSREFEACWVMMQSPEAGDCYLEGTNYTIANLLSSDWEILSCARCTMPIPLQSLGQNAVQCPCHDLAMWPNTELPLPRAPVDSTHHLQQLQRMLRSRDAESEL
ncbi:hypothetical protein GS597_05980 [Synechococcales cyanobacterium C]|uniref:Uncharacterized protein n=1 Tax=Petrachloros mirabilis ULC683 TaxID=2781853 RepID=A0A8K2A7G8_9CYAN|nr:hypothetical protein [Petrachloros mirabilis]NCJ06070.1 hypothetical protein [Petrachloros mirabilis ULC683]